MGDATGPGYSKVGGDEICVFVDAARIIDNDGPDGSKSEVNIVAKEKRIDAGNEIYYTMHPSKNRISTMLNKTNKTLILISS